MDLIHGAPSIDSICVVIPAYLEEDTVGNVVRKLGEFGLSRVRVVDNGSTDATARRAAEAGAEVIAEPRRGYGQACWSGCVNLPPDVEWILFCDADGSDDLDALPALLEAAADADLVIGNRMSTAAGRAAMSPAQRFGNWLAGALLGLSYGKPVHDLGPMRLVRRSAFDAMNLRDRGFGWTVEMQARAGEMGLGIAEAPVRYFRRAAGVSKISGTLRGTWMAGNVILTTLAAFLLRRVEPVTGWLSVTLLVGGCAAMMPFGDFTRARNVGAFGLAAAIACCGYLLSMGITRMRFAWFILGAVATRLLLLPMAPGSDIWRYVWEGMIQWHGFNPYLVPPDSAVVAALRADWWGRINNPGLTAGYPPLVELIFAVLAGISTSMVWFKVVIVAADLAIVALLARAFGMRRAAWYAWSPLVLYAFAGGGHFDPLFLLPAVAGWLAWDAGRTRSAALLVGVSAAIKYVTFPLIGFFVLRLAAQRRWREAGLTAILGVAPYCVALAWFWLRDGMHALAPAFMVTRARSAEFIPWIIAQVEPATRAQNALYLAPFALVTLWLLWRARGVAAFMDSFFFWMLAWSPAVHGWYFTWAMPFACATGNPAWRVAGISAFVYFVLDYRQALGDLRWEMWPNERFLLWAPVVLAYAWFLAARKPRRDSPLPA